MVAGRDWCGKREEKEQSIVRACDSWPSSSFVPGRKMPERARG
jgi:hypothetical protein